MKLQDLFEKMAQESFQVEQQEVLEQDYKYLDNIYLNIKDNKLHIDEFIKNHRHINYCEAVIYRDGTIAYVNPSHVETLIRATGLTHSEVYNEIPIWEHTILWLVNKTGCIAVWYGDYVAPKDKKLTLEQHITLKKLSNSNIVSF